MWRGEGNCARFCSPDNAMFQTIEEVWRHHNTLLRELKAAERDKKKMRLELEKRKKKLYLMMKKPKLTNPVEWKPTIPEVLERQKKMQSGASITRKAEGKRARVGRERISTKQLQHFFYMRDYPISINSRTKKLWGEKERFRTHYLPMIYIANRQAHLQLLETYVAAKWREVMAWDDNTAL